MEDAQLTRWQMFLLTLSFILGTTFFIRPGGSIAAAKEYAWLVPLWSGSYGLVLALLWFYLAKFHPNLSIVQICTKVLGNKVGMVFGSLYIFFFIQIGAWVLRNLGDFIKTNLLMHTPITIVHLMFLLVSSYTVIKGIEALAMITEFTAPIVIIVFWIVFFLMLTEWDSVNFGPAEEFRPLQLIASSKQVLGFPYSESVCLMMLFPFVKDRAKRSVLSGIALAAILMSLIVFFVSGIVGVYRASHLLYPLYTLAQELQLTLFLDHLEVTIVIIWFTAISIKLSTAMYCAVLGISQLLKLKNRVFVTFPLVWIILPMSLLFNSVVDNIKWDINFSYAYDTIYAVCIPLVLIIATWIRNKRVIA